MPSRQVCQEIKNKAMSETNKLLLSDLSLTGNEILRALPIVRRRCKLQVIKIIYGHLMSF